MLKISYAGCFGLSSAILTQFTLELRVAVRNRPALFPTREAGTRFTYPGRMEGWVDLGGWLHTEIVYLPAGSHPSKY